MANIYQDSSVTEQQNPNRESQPAATAAEAVAVAGAGVGFRGSYGGAGGKAARDYVNYQYAQQQYQQEDQEQQRIQQQREQQIDMNVGGRPGYYDPRTLGGTRTQQLLRMADINKIMFAQMGVDININREQLTGSILEGQRKMAESTPGLRDDRFYLNELQKWGHNPIEESSEYHAKALATGVQQAANPLENRGDVALAFEKAGNVKDDFGKNYAFNPNVRTMIGVLPEGKGTQEYAWQAAVTGERPPVDFMPGVRYLNAQVGRQGVYGSLYGGIPDTVQVSPVESAPIAEMKVTGIPAGVRFTGTIEKVRSVGQPVETVPGSSIIEQGNKAILGITGIGAQAIEQGSTTGSTPVRGTDYGAMFLDNLQKSFRAVFSSIPGGIPLAMASDTTFAILRKDAERLPFADLVKPSEVKPTGIIESLADTYEKANIGLAPYTTDIAGTGKALAETKDIEGRGIGGDILNFGKGVYVGASQHPIDILATFAGGEALAYGKGALKLGVAKAATSTVPGLSTAGRVLSTPTAVDITKVAEVGIGGVVVYAAGKNIVEQPTATEKGEALGRTAAQFAGFGAGMANVKLPEPVNPYSGRGFFSGKPEIGPIEKLQFKVETGLRSLKTSQPSAYRDVAEITLPGRVVEPTIQAEPNFAELSRSGKYAQEIKTTLTEQPHSVIGSSTVRQQYPQTVADKYGLRVGKDVDALIESPAKASARLSQLTGIPKTETATVLDTHPIPQNYPGLKPSVEPETATPESSLLTRLFGDPYRKIATPRGTSEIVKPGTTPGYTGKLTYEQAQVQFGRKAAAVSALIEEPLAKGYRGEKDLYDFITEYGAQKAIGISTGTPPAAFVKSDVAMTRLMQQELTYGTVKGQQPGDTAPLVTRTVQDIYTSMFKQAATARPGDIKLTFISEVPESGGLSSMFKSIPPTSIFVKSAFKSTPSEPSSPPPSSPGSIQEPVSPYPSTPISPPSILPSIAPTLIPSITPMKTPNKPPYISPPISPTPPPSTPPYTPPSVPPYTPPYTPPSVPPYTPPHSPPYTPPYSPPYTPPEIPPILPPFFGSGGGFPVISKRRSRSFWELFPVGLDISSMAAMGVRKRPRAKPKKGRVIPKSMLTPVKRKKK